MGRMDVSVRQRIARWVIGAVFIGLVAVGITVCIQKQEDSPSEPVAVEPAAFSPLTLLGFHVISEEVQAGTQGFVKNGFCLEGESARVVEIFIGIEFPGDDPSLGKPPYPLQGTADTPEGRERFPIEPGCIAQDEPLTFDVPAEFGVGEYRLYIHMRVVGPNNQVQDIVERSNTFSVVP